MPKPPVVPRYERGIALLRNPGARAAPDGRARSVEAENLVVHEGGEVHDVVRQHRGTRVLELGEIANVGHVRDAEALTAVPESVEQPEEWHAAVFGNELDEVRRAGGENPCSLRRVERGGEGAFPLAHPPPRRVGNDAPPRPLRDEEAARRAMRGRH